MTFDQLTYFLAAARYLNFSKAAEELFLHQSTISKSFAQLEQETGGPLFIRRGSALSLTDTGKLLLQEAPSILGRLDNLLLRAQRMQQEDSLQLSVLSTNNHLSCLAPFFRQFQPQHPNVEWIPVHLPHNDISSACERVRRGEVDFALVPEPELPESLEELCVDFIYGCPYQLAVAPDHPFAGQGEITVSQLSGIRIFRSRYTKIDLVHPINYMLSQLHLPPVELAAPPDSDRKTGLDDLIFMMVCAGYGTYLVPETAIHSSGYGCASVYIQELSAPEYQFRLFLVRRADNTNPALAFFLRTVSASLSQPQ